MQSKQLKNSENNNMDSTQTTDKCRCCKNIVPLTDEEIAEVMVQIWSNNNIPVRERSHRLARAIEAAHGIKG